MGKQPTHPISRSWDRLEPRSVSRRFLHLVSCRVHGCGSRYAWGGTLLNINVELDLAQSLMEGMRTGKVGDTSEPSSSMGKLDCKTT